VRRTTCSAKILTKPICHILIVLAATFACGQEQEAALNFVASQTTVNFTLGDVLHTVHGSFHLKSGQVHFAFATNTIGGEIVVDAASGNSGSGARDRKMHKEILESAQYSEITFRPDRVEGKVLAIGTSHVQVHGVFVIHGAEHEITVPAQVELAPDHWNLTVHFDVPYVKWGLKDPSTFILRVEKTADIDLHASGSSPWLAQR
jgi:polyisoprenoid-binding protein YceI